MKTLHNAIIIGAISSAIIGGVIFFMFQTIISGPETIPRHNWSQLPAIPVFEEPGNITGIVTIKNQAYYFTTLNDTMITYHQNPLQMSFHDVVFTFFPSPPYMGPVGICGGFTLGADTKFSDGIHELLRITILDMSCGQNYTNTDYSNHTNPQAGLTVHDGKIRLLVSTKNKSSTEIALPTPIKDCNKKKDLPDMGCFIESFKTCSPAIVQQTRFTVEGDPISVTAIIESNASNECKIHVHYDSKDKFGFQGQYDSLCNDMRAIDQFYWVIDQCENKEHVFELFNQ